MTEYLNKGDNGIAKILKWLKGELRLKDLETKIESVITSYGNGRYSKGFADGAKSQIYFEKTSLNLHYLTEEGEGEYLKIKDYYASKLNKELERIKKEYPQTENDEGG